ncbi:MAG TPA: (4Fe-4S)-binding protein [Dehalococcoidia bacterium]|nr:(4Fe-4S)-binding protein [Dehalococcoidia bacterium]
MGATREYKTEGIVVFWDAERCIHAQECVRGLPHVFNRQERPWIHVDRAAPDEIARVIRRCPSGALHYERTDGGEQEPVPEASVEAVPDGPLYVRGNLEIRGPSGRLIRRDTRLALCRCGQSLHKPFCDNTHRATGFRDGTPAGAAGQVDGEL